MIVDKFSASLEALRGLSLSTKAGLAGSPPFALASWQIADVVLRDLAALASLILALIALYPIVMQWIRKKYFNDSFLRSTLRRGSAPSRTTTRRAERCSPA